MATTYRLRYKNSATPQEQHSAGDRYYLDSGAGKKFSGTGDIGGATLGGSRDLVENFAVTDSASSALTGSTDFFYIKNTGDNDVLLSVGEALSLGFIESFAACRGVVISEFARANLDFDK